MNHFTQGQPAPTTTPTPDPIQLFADAVNSASMAAWYSKRGNWQAAARKARQHLAALRQLQKLEGGAV